MPAKHEFIPVNEPDLQGNEKRYLNECIDSGWISSEGPFVARFESMLAERVDRKFGIAVSSGTAALEVAVAALEMSPGAEVIMPSFTIVSCAAAIIRAGLVPVVVDADPHTWNLNVDQLEGKITEKTRAIMVVHIYGLPTDMGPVLSLAKKHELRVIEDAAEAIGQKYLDKQCGSFGDISVFSFYPNKHVTTGEGGMILCDDPALARRCQSLRNLCFGSEKRFVHSEIGWNYRMTNLQAAVGVAQLERLDQFLTKKRRIGRCYDQLLGDNCNIQGPLAKTSYATNLYWVYGLVLKDHVLFDALEILEKLKQLGIGARPFFWPMDRQPVFIDMGLFAKSNTPVAAWLAKRGFYIPSGLGLTDDQIVRTAEAINSILA
jgi:perosamine synthetase